MFMCALYSYLCDEACAISRDVVCIFICALYSHLYNEACAVNGSVTHVSIRMLCSARVYSHAVYCLQEAHATLSDGGSCHVFLGCLYVYFAAKRHTSSVLYASLVCILCLYMY